MSVRIETVEAALLEFVSKDILLRKALIEPNDDIFDAGFDSLSLSRVLVFVEERFGILVPEEDVDIGQIATVASMARFFHDYIAKTKA